MDNSMTPTTVILHARVRFRDAAFDGVARAEARS
jgi:hypothetical protein